ncbi:ribosome maturation factor RimP [Gordonia sp. PP30]|uniref:ribosome maturation factor RimP n=1 Tax=Gordonia sp. PP30 TaxID=2935861 RepID=UPI001FFFFB35|nr:ribosome maturation factor RimP [Gordonia sp. PP30]UQE73395.1 ribosome maturation factor RimP [Gordonia sp. PP30]
MSHATSEQIGDVVRPVVTGLGYDLEDVVVGGRAGHEVRIVVDRDGGASLDDLAEVSRALSDVLDAADPFGDDPYELEVSTPGAERALTAPRHWRRARGRKVAVRRRADGDEQMITGRVGDTDEESVTLVTNVKGRMSETTIPLADVVHARVEVDFTRPGPAELRRCGLDDDEIERRRRPAE